MNKETQAIQMKKPELSVNFANKICNFAFLHLYIQAFNTQIHRLDFQDEKIPIQ